MGFEWRMSEQNWKATRVVSCTFAFNLFFACCFCFKAFAEDILEELRTKAAMAEEVHLLSWSFFSWKT